MTIKQSKPKWIHFQLEDNSPHKTDIWSVLTNDGEDTLLGHIKWYYAWRQYSFYTDSPFTDLVFEKQCLRDIANFCEEQTKLHYEECKKNRALKETNLSQKEITGQP